MPRVHRPPISLAKVAELASKPTRAGKTIVIVGTVTDDNRFYQVPKLTVSKHFLEIMLDHAICMGLFSLSPSSSFSLFFIILLLNCRLMPLTLAYWVWKIPFQIGHTKVTPLKVQDTSWESCIFKNFWTVD